MLFNSYEFLFAFLPIVFFVYYFLLSKKLVIGAKGFLVLSSLFFYSWWNIVYLPLILSSMLFNYIVGNSLNGKNEKVKIKKKTLLTIGLVVNLGLLGYFKYVDFFIYNINYFSGRNMDLLHLSLPLAISFFTFQQIAYLVDSYRKETGEYNFLNYALFVTFFPQLIAGPIVHHKEIIPQFNNKWNLLKDYKNIATGLFIFSIGLFKKLVIADTFAIWATNGFDRSITLNLLESWTTSLSYTFQLYFDFSGYSDMAIGAALLFNIKLPINFNSPYKAKDIQDFWRRWHITLSRFLRDYIYIPLGGNRISSFRTYNNLILTFILGGLWHGAGWTFIFWGFLHGVALVIHNFWKKLGYQMNSVLAWFITFNFVNIAWVFFRAKEFEDAIKVLKGMFGFSGIILPAQYEEKFTFLNSSYVDFGNMQTVTYIIVAFIIVLKFKSTVYYQENFETNCKNLLITLLFLFTAISMMSRVSEFLYFNF